MSVAAIVVGSALRAVQPPGGGRYLAVHLHPDVLVVMAALAIGYWWAITRLGPRLVRPGEVVVSHRMVTWWYSGVALLWVFAEWPIHDLAEHYSYAVHMTEHLVFSTACAPLLLLGMPGWMLRWAVVDRPWYRPVRLVCRPLPAIVLNAVVLFSTHWPAVTNETTHNEWFHFSVHLVLFGSALALWMPLINRVPELPRLSKPLKILYLFGQSFAPVLPTLYLIFARDALYKAYLPGLAWLGWSATGDQEIAGSLMGAVQPLVLWALAAYVFFSWYADEARLDRTSLPDRLTWDDVERQFAAPAERG